MKKISYTDNTVWIDKACTTGFHGVPEPVWNFHIGGYQVCQKWLKDRALSPDDLAHYQKVALSSSPVFNPTNDTAPLDIEGELPLQRAPVEKQNFDDLHTMTLAHRLRNWNTSWRIGAAVDK